MNITPIILRLHPELDPEQLEVIGHTGGPLLVVAGPGSGKTLCIQLRAVNLLLTGQTAPEELLLWTFGRDAARQLRRRFAASAMTCRGSGQLSRVRLTTIHRLCQRVLAPHAAAVGLGADYAILNEEEQLLLMQQEYGAIFGPDRDAFVARGWREGAHTVAEAARHFDRICDEMIEIDALEGSPSAFSVALGRCLRRYRTLLREPGLMDFAHLQVWAEQVLRQDDIVSRASVGIRHLMVDEFQDVSWAQMRILHRLVGGHGNLAVVGDDDQSIYGFRGGRVANMPEFPRRFPACQVIMLTTNYRSHRSIACAVGRWMDSAAQWQAGGQAFRYAKDIVTQAAKAHPDYPAVISIRGRDSADEARQLAEVLRFLMRNGVIEKYGQVALLLHSVRGGLSGPYVDAMELAGIPARCEPAGHDQAIGEDEVVVTTIHQAKGREWDVVIVGSLTEPDTETDRVSRNLAEFFECPEHCGETA